jgi:hypothetical protein
VKRTLQVVFILIWIVVTVLVIKFLQDANWLNSWWKSALTLLPEIAVPVIAIVELRHSAEANHLRTEANESRLEANQLRSKANELREENNELQERIAALQRERNTHLEQIAQNTKRPRSHGERNAELLRAHLAENVRVDEAQNSWGSAQIAEVSDDNIVVLFTPSGYGSEAWAQPVHCDDLDVVEMQQGECTLRLNIRKRYGNFVRLGEIKRYEDRMLPTSSPSFERGDVAYQASYELKGTAERRTLRIYKSKEESNSFLFEASTGERLVGDNRAVSKRLLATRVDYLDRGFSFGGESGPNSQFRLYINNQ